MRFQGGTITRGCARCGFEADDYTARDLRTSPQWLTGMADQAIDGVDAAVLADEGVRACLHDLRALVGRIDTRDPDPALVHAAIHEVRGLGRLLHDAGAGVAPQQGSVLQLNAGGGGVPKLPVLLAEVGRRGLVGDRQATRAHHGRPFQALCLWSSEVIDALVDEGHPIFPGATGENITVTDIDWAALRPGARLRIGEVLCELSAWATPCRQIDQFFAGRSTRVHHDRHPGSSRVYAWVLEPGTIAVGDPVLVEG